MQVEELQDFIDWEIKRLNGPLGKNDEEMKSWDSVKLVEETGEFLSEVRTISGIYRDEKKKEFSKENFGNEFVDVIISACIIARRHNIDIVDSIVNKIEIIRRRKYE